MAIPYAKIRPSLQTGDIVLFSGHGWISRLIQAGTFSQWSHVGVVIRMPDRYDAVMLLESTTMSKANDIISGRAIRGVSLVQLSERVRRYGGDVGIRRLINIERDDSFISAFAKLRHELHGRAYPSGYWELIKSAIDIPFFKNKRNLKTVFCSELVAEAYMRAKVLSRYKMPSNEYTPADFAKMTSHTMQKGDLSNIEIINT